jgi:hypothetical protein
MPEHETFDFETAFARLERDIADITSPHGARLAVATARRRRRTTVGGALAVALVTVGAVVAFQGSGRNASVGPADATVPSPAPLTPEALSAATAGWVGPWQDPPDVATIQGGDHQESPGCALHGRPWLGDFLHRGSAFYSTAAGQTGDLVSLEYPTAHADVFAADLKQSYAGCRPAASDTIGYDDGSSAAYYDVPVRATGGEVQVWTARWHDRQAVFVLDATGTAPPEEVVLRVADALVAALQVDSTLHEHWTGKVTSAAFGTLTAQELAPAFAGWDSGLSTGSGGPTRFSDPPCWVGTLPGNSVSADSSHGLSIGTNGAHDTFDFGSPALARHALAQVVQQWRSCNSTPYSVRTVDVPGRGPLTLATSTGARAATNWAVQSGRLVTLLGVTGGSNPPDSVSQAVGRLLYDVLTLPPPLQTAPALPVR